VIQPLARRVERIVDALSDNRRLSRTRTRFRCRSTQSLRPLRPRRSRTANHVSIEQSHRRGWWGAGGLRSVSRFGFRRSCDVRGRHQHLLRAQAINEKLATPSNGRGHWATGKWGARVLCFVKGVSGERLFGIKWGQGQGTTLSNARRIHDWVIRPKILRSVNGRGRDKRWGGYEKAVLGRHHPNLLH